MYVRFCNNRGKVVERKWFDLAIDAHVYMARRITWFAERRFGVYAEIE